MLLSVIAILAFSHCKKDKEEPAPVTPTPTPAPAVVKVNDATSLSSALNIEGAIKKTGGIPAPTSATYGRTLDVTTPQVVLTSGNSFDFELKTTNQAKIVFIKLAGTNEYFQVTLDENGSFIRTANGTTKIRQCCTPDGCASLLGPGKGGNIESTFNVQATVQVFEPPVQAGVPDLSFLSDPQYWSPPQNITYKCFKTGTGSIFMTLTWNKTGDVDLWLKEPNGNKISYLNKISSTGGELDFDNTSGFGPENIFFEGTAPNGRYEVWAHYYSEYSGPTDWVLSLKNNNTMYTERGTLVNEDDSVLIKVFTR